MGEKFLKTASSRALLVAIVVAIVVAAPVVAMFITAFTTGEPWFTKPKHDITLFIVWTFISQLVVTVLLMAAAFTLLSAILAIAIAFFFDTRNPRNPWRSSPPPPFKTLRDRSQQYDNAIVKLREGFAKLGGVIRSPFRALHRSIDDWVDRGE